MNTPFCHTHGWAHDVQPDVRACRIEDWNTVPGIVIDSVEVEPEPEPFFVLGTGRLAYLNAVAGPVPVRVIEVDEDQTTVEVTASREGYRRGEYLHVSNPTISLLHRGQVSRRTHKVSGTVRLITDEGNLLP
jgi:hypothetical protein